MRVLIGSFSFHPYEGGAEKQGRLLAQSLARRGVDVRYVTARLPGTARDELWQGVPIHRVTVGPRLRGFNRAVGEPLYLLGLRRFLHTVGRDYDLFQAQGTFEITAPMMAATARRMGKPAIVRYAGMDDLGFLRATSPLARLLWRAVFQADASVTNSAATLQRLLGEYHLPQSRCVLIPNAVEDAPRIERAAARQRLGWAHDWRVALSVGRFDALKNHALLIRAWPRVLRAVPGARLVLVGQGKQWAACNRLVADLGLEQQVYLPGGQTNIADYLAASNVFAFPSQSEGQPNALLEAMVAALPCAVSAIPGTRALADPAIEALFFDPGDADAAANMVSVLFQDAALAQRLGTAARARALSQHSIGAITDAYVQLYQRVLNQTGPA